MAGDISHPVFARFFDRFSRMIEKDVGRYRDELLDGLAGHVVEVGAGNGINFRRYPSSVERVTAIEPEPYLRARALRAAAQAPVKVTVHAGTAEELGLADGSADAVVSSLVLCSVRDQAAALGEVRRVLQEAGQLRFFEHVRSAKGGKARAQRAADATLWPRLAGGCHAARDTVGAIQAAGFAVEHIRSVDVGPTWAITNPHVVGSAVRA